MVVLQKFPCWHLREVATEIHLMQVDALTNRYQPGPVHKKAKLSARLGLLPLEQFGVLFSSSDSSGRDTYVSMDVFPNSLSWGRDPVHLPVATQPSGGWCGKRWYTESQFCFELFPPTNNICFYEYRGLYL